MTAIFMLKTGVLSLTLALALYHDLRQRKIKNIVTLPAAAAGVVLNFVEQGPAGLLASFFGWLAPVLLLMVFYRINTMGAGDVKLFAAIGAVMGLDFAAYSFMFAVYAGGLAAMVILVRNRGFVPCMRHLVNYLRLLLITRGISVYSDREGIATGFIFSWAIALGTVIQLLRVVLG